MPQRDIGIGFEGITVEYKGVGHLLYTGINKLEEVAAAVLIPVPDTAWKIVHIQS